MRRVILVVALFVGVIASTTAQDKVAYVVEVTDGTVIASDDNLAYYTQTIEAPGLEEIVSHLPVVVTLVDGSEGHIEINYPKAEAEYLRCKVYDNGKSLIIGRNGDVEQPKRSHISEHTPVRVTLSVTTLRSIANMGDMSLNIEHDSFDKWLNIVNSSTLFINASSISADDKIELVNHGTMTCHVDNWRTENLMLTNAGYLFVEGTTTAKYIEQNSIGIDSTNLEVDCSKLEVTSTGSGVIEYRGTADEVNITSLGQATIRTSELNNEQ
uniref:GIN domain-containing protein n=1 Tax=Alistipes sp. TaxID=1872444 RepID=UPI004055CE59